LDRKDFDLIGLGLSDDDEPADEMALIEARLEYLAEVAERCRKIILASQLAIAVGAGGLLVSILGLVVVNENVAIAGIAVVLAGIVSWGSNVSTLRQTHEEIEEAERQRADMIDRKHLRVVSDTGFGRT
jgi:hypothetical protein